MEATLLIIFKQVELFLGVQHNWERIQLDLWNNGDTLSVEGTEWYEIICTDLLDISLNKRSCKVRLGFKEFFSFHEVNYNPYLNFARLEPENDV